MLDSANVPDHAQNVREKLNRLSQIAVSPPSSRLNQATNSDLMKLGKGDDMLNDIVGKSSKLRCEADFPGSFGTSFRCPMDSLSNTQLEVSRRPRHTNMFYLSTGITLEV